jgi:hypothetical protein
MTKAQLQDEINNLKADVECWRTIAGWDDATLADTIELIKKTGYKPLPDPWPTKRSEIIAVLDTLVSLDDVVGEQHDTP